MAEVLHDLIAYIAIAVVVGGVGWSAALALTGRASGQAFMSFQAAVVAVIIAAAASGLVLLSLGHSPTEGLHFMYGAIAIAIIPLARSFFGRAQGRGQALLSLLAFAVLGVIVFRLFASG